MRLTFAGVRGSTSVPGRDVLRYGGNIACIAVHHGSEPTRLLLDGGTGTRVASALIDGTALLGYLSTEPGH